MSSPAAGPPVSEFVARRRRVLFDTDPAVARKRLALIVVLAVLLRILAWSGTVQMASDGADSLWQAQRLQAGDIAGALSHPDPPLYALAIVAASFLTRQLVWAAVLVSIVSGVLIVFAVHGLARLALPGRRDVACGAAALAALYTPVVVATGNVTSDGLFLALFLIALRLLFAGEQSGRLRLRLFGVGIFLGLAWLTRAEAAFLLLPVVAWLIAGLVRRESRRHRPMPPRGVYLRAAGLCLLGLLIAVAPYAVLLHRHSGSWSSIIARASGLGLIEPPAAPLDSPLGSPRVGVVTEGEPAPSSWLPADTHRLALALESRFASTIAEHSSKDGPEASNPAAPPVAGADGSAAAKSTTSAPDAAPADGQSQPPQRPLRPMQRVLRGAQTYFAAYAQAAATLAHLLGPGLLLLAAVGLPTVLRRRALLCSMLVILQAGWVALAAAQIMTRGTLLSRDLLGPALLVLPVAGAGVAWLWGELRRFPNRSVGQHWLGRTLVLLVVALEGVALAGTLLRTDSTARLAALHWAREHSTPGERVGVIERRDAWYVQRPILTVGRPADGNALAAELQRQEVRLLVQRLDDLRQEAPELLAGGAYVERARFGEGAEAIVVLERQG
jgi:4-amino-4-deoxy-L-arabinose transferase-like glycosyltransferase